MEELEGKKVTENIYLCPDGKYRWVYEFSMIRNPTILLTIWKIFGGIILVMLVLSFFIELFQGNAADWFTSLLDPGILIVPGIMLVLSLIGYFIVAAMYGWKYMVLFEMDEEKVVHQQMPKQFEKAEAMGWLTTFVGALAGSPTTMGSGLLAASRSTLSSTFEYVKKVKRNKALNVIYVIELLDHNQVYAKKEDFDFVWEFITKRCTKAKIK